MDFSKFSIFKLPNKHKRFEFTPRYYDPRKEAMDKKVAEIEHEQSGISAEGKRREISFKAKADDRWGNSGYKTASMRQNLRLLLILGMLVVVVYYIFQGIDGLEPVIEMFYK